MEDKAQDSLTPFFQITVPRLSTNFASHLMSAPTRIVKETFKLLSVSCKGLKQNVHIIHHDS
jgi:hypothetical protein